MLFALLKILSIVLLLLTLFMAWRTRRDLERGETSWGRALFHKSAPVYRAETPLRYWLATLCNVASVVLFALAAVFLLRAGMLHFTGR